MNIKTDKLNEIISKSRPNLKPNSVKQYEVQLKKLKNLFDSDDYKFLKNPENVNKKLEGLHYTSVRNMYNAIIILLMALNSDKKMDKLIGQYSELRDELNHKYEDEQKSGVISDKQKDNFVDMSEVEKMISQLKSDVTKLKKKKTLTKMDISTLRAYTLFSMLSRIPTRNDASNMMYISQKAYKKLSDEEKQKNNYLVNERNNMKFIYNVYKTSKKYGENVIPVPPELKPVMRLYIKLMDYKVGDNIFPMSRNAISQLLLKTSKKYMGKNISSTMLRKIYLSSKYGKLKEEMEKDASMMGHSVDVAQSTYVKNKE
jgi:integrase